jgi:glutathione S-transferase
MLKEKGYFLLGNGSKSDSKVSLLDEFEGKKKFIVGDAAKESKPQVKRRVGRPRKTNESIILTE